MGWLRARLGEGSSYAGAGLSIEPILRLFATGGHDVTAWGALAMSIAAFCMSEKGAA